MRFNGIHDAYGMRAASKHEVIRLRSDGYLRTSRPNGYDDGE